MKSNKRLIFTVTSGRSGTAYLTYLLKGLPGVVSVHEDRPHFGDPLPEARTDEQLATDFLVHKKLPHIEKMPGHIYFEASHYFAKGYVKPLIELGVPFDLILLRRHPRKIATSWYLIGGRLENLLNGRISRHVIGPNEPNFLPAQEWRHWNDYQLCYWYALETHFRARHYAQMVSHHGGRIFEIYLKSLVSGPGYGRLLEWLEIPVYIIESRVGSEELRSRVINDKSETKRDYGRETDLRAMNLDALEAEVRHTCGLPESIEELLRGPIHLC